MKKIHTELKFLLSNRFEIIKSSLGIQNDAEVLRFLIQYYYRKKFESKEVLFKKGGEPKEDEEIWNRFNKKYSDAFKRLGEEE